MLPQLFSRARRTQKPWKNRGDSGLEWELLIGIGCHAFAAIRHAELSRGNLKAAKACARRSTQKFSQRIHQ